MLDAPSPPAAEAPALIAGCAIVTLSEISVTDLEIMADIGVHNHEVGSPQPLIVSVTLQVKPPQEDDIKETFNYANIVHYSRELGARRVALIESFARLLAEACLRHPLVREAEVSVRKPRALPGCVAGARVKLRQVGCA